jgi:hypothetical protein
LGQLRELDRIEGGSRLKGIAFDPIERNLQRITVGLGRRRRGGRAGGKQSFKTAAKGGPL